ncbi:hypothetical protein GUITHDRAFT_101053 [Guillardia theta CCMP2712]|uniref:N-alpha-acetyltransferase 40 n=1 Tax=Guillardia theta (strain CCMP2712) TaxID=905079 RepID=L1JYS6_GUITC|nr:hypothetical protein GUITHDRAFT_101053 [Guillardia theta CCMP2712]EKX53350.1 hypothetical protein GUITHDRAFT_101053 [Guillardia theta CCMP2712]|eukprot:XP_005840330.1 hypothetical protein GUITHDRAFT_101053 [Guillardia theta CCMP2712]
MGFVLFVVCFILFLSDLSHALVNLPVVAQWRMRRGMGGFFQSGLAVSRARRAPFGEAALVHHRDSAEERVFAARISDGKHALWDVGVLRHPVSRDAGVVVHSYRRDELKPADVDELFALTKRNMKEMYERSSWGWSDVDKRLAFDSPPSRFLIATVHGRLVAFAHYQFEVLEDERTQVPFASLYVLELQVENDFQRRGIGRLLLDLLCSNASGNGRTRRGEETSLTCRPPAMKMDSVMLCVFRYNTNALAFYKNSGFNPDTSSDYNQVLVDDFQLLC